MISKTMLVLSNKGKNCDSFIGKIIFISRPWRLQLRYLLMKIHLFLIQRRYRLLQLRILRHQLNAMLMELRMFRLESEYLALNLSEVGRKFPIFGSVGKSSDKIN